MVKEVDNFLGFCNGFIVCSKVVERTLVGVDVVIKSKLAAETRIADVELTVSV
jgi:hypothetical protein